MFKKTITKAEFAELSKVMDALEIIQKYDIVENINNNTEFKNILETPIIQTEKLKSTDQEKSKNLNVKNLNNSFVEKLRQILIDKPKEILMNLPKNYLSIGGRIARLEFYTKMFIIFFIWFVVAICVNSIYKMVFGDDAYFTQKDLTIRIVKNITGVILSFLLLSSIICINVRRLHDANRNGWWVTLLIITSIIANILEIFKYNFTYQIYTNASMINVIILIGYLIIINLKGSKGDNRYGKEPKPNVK
jgi:uncharacterized membrane protein YhaH (DUF805 family)